MAPAGAVHTPRESRALGPARRTSRCPAGRLRRAACPASGAVCGPAATAQCGRAAPPTSPLGRRAARDPHSAWDDCSAESHGVSQPRSRLRGLRGGALAWARMSTARTAAAGPPRCETRGSRAPSAGRAMPSAGPRLALDAPPPQPRVRAHARTVFCAKPGVGGGLPPAPAARGTLARPAVYLLSAFTARPRRGAGCRRKCVNLTHVPGAPSDHAVVLSWG